MANNNLPVIVTNAKNRVSYNIIKSLGKKNIDVYAADSMPRSMSFFSRYSKDYFLYPSPFNDSYGFVDFLNKRAAALNAGVLIPVHEETYLIAKHKDRLSSDLRTVIPSYEQILITHNKDRCGQFAGELGIPVPQTYRVDELKSAYNKMAYLHYPLLIKPKQGGGAWGITQINSSNELKVLLSQDSYYGLPWERFICQQKVLGETHCVAMLFREGEIKAKVTYKQIRDYPVTGGQATLRVSISNPTAEDYLFELLKKLKWHGVCQADFVVEKETQIPFLIDINPRFWGSLVQAIASGVDFPYLIYRIAVDGDIEPIPSFKTGVTTRWLGGDLLALFSIILKSNRKLKLIKDFFFSKGKNRGYDDFSWRDPLPFFIWFLNVFLRIIKSGTFKPSAYDSLNDIWR